LYLLSSRLYAADYKSSRPFIMKAFILAAGSGTRLRPLTDSVPKCLLPIQGVPLLQIWLENCAAAGISEVLVNVHSHAGKIRDFAQTHRVPVQVHIAEEEELLGSAGTLAANREFVGNEEIFLVLYGDVLTNVNLADLLSFHRQNEVVATLGIHQVPDPTQCGIVITDERGIVSSFVEKPAQPAGNWAFSGIMAAGQQLFDSVPKHRPADIGFHLLPHLVGRMSAYRISGFLLDIGTLHTYRAAQTSWPGLSGG
jgi:mannose-1-phosphate guanylyltransferase